MHNLDYFKPFHHWVFQTYKSLRREQAPRLPYLSPVDFFLWGYLKSKVFSFCFQESKLKIELQPGAQLKTTQLGPLYVAQLDLF